MKLTWELSIAASRGHLDAARFLHARGVPLWDNVKPTYDCRCVSDLMDGAEGRVLSGRWLYVRTDARLARSFWGVMRYGEMHGAPLPESEGWVFRERRRISREVLLCFHSAVRLSRAGGTHARMWALMADVPLDVVYIFLVCAELEMPETFNPGAIYQHSKTVRRKSTAHSCCKAGLLPHAWGRPKKFWLEAKDRLKLPIDFHPPTLFDFVGI
jgi:hypothetical protein